ncbi:PREDICTED: protein MNN4-like [Nicotiana attenuata]|uniref:protein MNN4-like n=1 Tax=Nicotiana attenuata TaxID=49451 RepID=UPI0009047D3D|nr:PREDICTED: protein MNN4-like [Nicotiana attenuata]
MLARKTVSSGSLRKALNEKLRASQKKEGSAKESDSTSESETFISASEGEEHGYSNTDKNQETPGEVNTCLVFSDVIEKVDNRVKQSEAELQKTLEESRKKKKEKGKAKVVESSKAAEEEEEEMELMHQEIGTTVKVPTPKPKRSKTSSKKSSKPVSTEPSLAKRTRTAVKGKQNAEDVP